MNDTSKEFEEITSSFLSHFEGHTIYISMSEYGSTRPLHYHSGYSESAVTLRGRNRQFDYGEKLTGEGVFFTVNELDESKDKGRHRTKKMLKTFRAIFMDDDEIRGDNVARSDSEFPLVPSLVVNTSRGRFHYYWLILDGYLDEVVTREAWEQIQEGLVSKYEGDMNARDISRYLRLPGYYHNKDPKNPQMVRWSGEGTKYKWVDLVEAFGDIAAPIVKENKKKKKELKELKVEGSGDLVGLSAGFCDSVSKSVYQYEADIRRGVNLHGSLLSMSYQMIKEGVGEKYIVIAMQGLMKESSARESSSSSSSSSGDDERWLNRYNEIEGIVRGGIERVALGKSREQIILESKKIDLTKLKSKLSIKEIKRKNESSFIFKGAAGTSDPGGFGVSVMPWPPGFLGELARVAWNNQLYQSREVAILSAVGLVAGIAGRKFNFHRMGLNVYLTLIMRTGMGKDSISDFIDGVLANMSELGMQRSFVGANRFTSAKSIMNQLKDSRSMICVFSEAGLMMQSKAGDQDGIKRALLGLYSKSGHKKFSAAESFSADNNSVPSLESPALSNISEATPETLLRVFKDRGALESGEISRQSIYRVDGDKPEPNGGFAGESYRLSGALGERLADLVKTCGAVQRCSDPEPYVMELEDRLKESRALVGVMDQYRKMENDCRDIDDRRSIMASRAAVKVMKFAALCGVLNLERDLTIYEESWSWSLAMVEFEMEGLDQFFESESGVEIDGLICGVFQDRIIRLLRDDEILPRYALPLSEREVGLFKKAGLHSMTKDLKEVKELNDDSHKSNPVQGFNKIIRVMCELGLIENKGKGLMMVTEEFFEL